MTLSLKNCTIPSLPGPPGDYTIHIDQDRIGAVHLGPESRTPSGDVFDLRGGIVVPGYIDLQVNGAGDALFQSDPTVDTLRKMASALLSVGVTSFLPTLTAATPDHIDRALDAISDLTSAERHSVLGINLEGPFINPSKSGMASVKDVVPFDAGMVRRLSEFGHPIFMTAAPEALSEKSLASLRDAGVVVSLGHTSTSFEDAQLSFSQGVNCATHLFNAMTGVAGRDPGLVGAVLDSDSVRTSLIADGFHVHPAVARLAFRTLGRERIFLISDGMPSLAGTVSEFDYGDHHVTDRGGNCTTEDGVLAGTGIDVGRACLQLSEWVGCPFLEGLPMITSTPAAVLGIGNDYGVVAAGAVANLAILDQDLRIIRTVSAGQVGAVVS